MENDKQKRDEVIKRIKKLLNLAGNNPSEFEAMAAALKAQRLIAEYDVERHEYAAEEKPTIESVYSNIHTTREWRYVLADIVSKNFRCQDYQINERKTRKGRNGGRWYVQYIKTIVFYGYKQDAQAASMVFDYLYKFGNRKATRLTKGLPNASSRYNSYVLGFCDGVRSELEKQSQALMLVVPKSVTESYEEMSKGWGEARDLRLELDGISAAEGQRYAKQGLIDGRDAVRARRMNEPENENLLTQGAG